MAFWDSGSEHKQAAIAAANKARDIYGYQQNVDYQKALLTNIRQQRLASAQLEILNGSDSYTSSSAANAQATLASGLASTVNYSYETTQRGEEVQHYQELAQYHADKYAKQQKRKGTAFSVIGAVAGAVTGGLAAGAVAGGMSAATGAGLGLSIGQGIGQIASNTGQTSAGVNNLIGAYGSYLGYTQSQEYLQKLEEMQKNFINTAYPTSGTQYTVSSIDVKTGQPFNTVEGSMLFLLGGNK